MENKLLEFQKKIQVIKKDSKNPHFKNTYASLTQILSEVKPILNELGLTLLQPIHSGEVFTVIFDNEKKIAESSIPLPTISTPQQLGSAITYFRRYSLASLLALEIDDDDANATQQVYDTVEKIKEAYKNGKITKEQATLLNEKLSK
jgi:hypothetical protein